MSNVAQFIGASPITGITGSGALVLSTSPTFLGTPAAPTPAAETNTTQIATTAFVKAAVDVLSTRVSRLDSASPSIETLMRIRRGL